MKRKKKYFIFIVLILLISAVGIYLFYLYSKKSECVFDFDCGWRATNCCKEEAGATWRCVNLKTFKTNCPDIVICPQVISPKPQTACVCISGECKTK